MLNRREVLGGMAAASLASARTLKTAGVQLYTVRSIIDKQTLDVLKAIESIGYREVEATWGNLGAIWPSLKQTALKPVSVHLDTMMFTRDQDKLPAALDDAAAKGFRYVVCPYVRKEDRGGAEVMRKLGETLNRAGEKAKKAGMTLCYHNHAFEFAQEGGQTLLDHLLKASDPRNVQLEMDVMWVAVAGADPAKLLGQYKNRVPLMHLKDVHKNIPTRLDEGIDRAGFAEVGAGRIDFAPVLRAASAAGTKHYFVEQDQTPGDPLASLRTSYSNLGKIQY